MTRRRRERRDADEDEAVVGCLDVLRGASALMAQHKAGLARLLPRRDEGERGALERLVSDLTEVLSTASTSSGGSSSRPQAGEREQREEDEGVVSDSEAAARRGGGGGGAMSVGGAKRVKAQQAAQAATGQQQGLSSSSAAVVACEGRDALAIPEVLEHVMSFAEDRELLGRLNRVCRLWRHVSEGERLSLRVVEQHMPSALVGGASSLHARLGGSARRCLLAHNASMTGGRLMCGEEQLEEVQELRLLFEIFRFDRALCVLSARLSSYEDCDEDDAYFLTVYPKHDGGCEVKAFSADSLGVPGTGSIHQVFRWGMLEARIFVMNVTTGVTASLFEGVLAHEGEAPEPDEQGWGRLRYTTTPVPVTSMTYAGPPLQAQVSFSVRACEKPGQDDMAGLASQRERLWKFDDQPELRFKGQPSIYGERFIRTRLAEEAMAAKKQHGSR